MAHNIAFNESTGKHSFLSVKENPWHSLGQLVQDYPTSAEALQLAGLDYRVEKQKLFTPCITSEITLVDLEAVSNPQVEVPNFFATVRNDNDAVLGVVGKDYEV